MNKLINEWNEVHIKNYHTPDILFTYLYILISCILLMAWEQYDQKFLHKATKKFK